MLKPIITVCYLCGQPLTGEKRLEDNDHVPPKQLMARSLRQKYLGIRLETLRTHRACNGSFNLDEEYFKHCFVPLARGSESGNAIVDKTVEEYKSGERVKLVDHVRRQAKGNVRGILLPAGKIFLDYDLARVERVVRKLIMGLHFLEAQEFLDAPASVGMIITLPGQPVPGDFIEITKSVSMQSRGHHQGVFAYSRLVDQDLHYWALLIWDRIIITACFRSLR